VGRPEPDLLGWDFLVHLRSKNAHVTHMLEVAPPELICFIQVKATRDLSRPIGVDVAAWMKLVRSALPAFFLVIGVDDRATPTVAYLVHVDEARGGKAIERAVCDGPSVAGDLRRLSLAIPLDASDRLGSLHGQDFRAAITAAVGADLHAYVNAKKRWVSEVGYEKDSSSRCTISMTGRSQDEINRALADLALGRIERVPIAPPEFRRVRFGTESPTDRDGGAEDGPAFLSFPSAPSFGTARVEVADPRTGEVIKLELEVRSASAVFPFLPEKFHELAFVSEFVSFYVTPAPTTPKEGRRAVNLTWSVSLPTPDDNVPLSRAAMLTKLLVLLGEQRAPVSIAMGDRRITFPANATSPEVTARNREISDLVGKLRVVLGLLGLALDPVFDAEEIFHRREHISFLHEALVNGRSKPSTLSVAITPRAGEPEPLLPDRAAFVSVPGVVLGDDVLVVVVTLIGAPRYREKEGRNAVYIQADEVRVSSSRVHPLNSAIDERVSAAIAECTALLDSEGIQQVWIP
jgi:hypothetical protein